MDFNILLALKDFRNGAGAFLADFLSKMTWLGELSTAGWTSYFHDKPPLAFFC